MERRQNAYPFPELIAPDRDWQVWEAPETMGRVNRVDKKMQVPLGQSVSDQAVRAHEMGHLKWTPGHKDFKKADPRWCELIEELRVNNLLMKEAGVDLDGLAYGDLPPPSAVVPEAIPLAVATGYALCIWNLKGHRKHLMVLDKQAFNYAHRVHKMLFDKGKVPTFDDTIEAALWLESKIKLTPPPLSPSKDHPSFITVPEVSKPKPLKIIEPSRTERARNPRFAHRKRTPSEDGSLFIAPHRWCVDRAVFDRHHKTYAATLLIDASSTMRMRRSALIRLLQIAPMATIGVYQSNASNCALTIVAKNGRRIKWDRTPVPGGGNEGDIHALNWLAQQPEPRYWISDGGVTTTGHKHSSINSINCKRILQKGRIKQMFDIQQAIGVIHGRERPLPRPQLTELDFGFNELLDPNRVNANGGLPPGIHTLQMAGRSASVEVKPDGTLDIKVSDAT